MRYCFLLILLSINQFVQGQDETYFFNRAARAYIKNVYPDSVCIYLKEGYKKYSTSLRLIALAEKANCHLSSSPNIGKDSDGDGILNNQDKCPKDKGPLSNNGCPETRSTGNDRDGDGVNDTQDKCPDQKGQLSNNGCPNNTSPPPPVQKDKDKDGILDYEDNCPNQRGTRANNGCPEEHPKPVGPVEVDVSIRRGSGNIIEWSPKLTKAAEYIRITFIDSKNRTWVDGEITSGNSYLYDPGDGRAGEIYTTVILDIQLKKGYVLKTGTKKKLEKQIFDCSAH
jgi:hypothetical protein